jgi:two-component system, OmpR family, KDP operon response regulator KdpE
MTRVLVVDDEPQIVRALQINLRARAYDVVTANSGRQALHVAAQHPPDVVILDLGLPDFDGGEVIRGLRGWTDVPIIVLSGRTQSAEKAQALDAGADDYVTKPFAMDELFARLRALSRRASPNDEQPRITIGNYLIDLAARTVTETTADAASTAPRLTPTEWKLLEVLARHPGKLISQRELLTGVWGPAYTREASYLRVYMGQLRRKLEPNPSRPRFLLTEPWMGYRFNP